MGNSQSSDSKRQTEFGEVIRFDLHGPPNQNAPGRTRSLITNNHRLSSGRQPFVEQLDCNKRWIQEKTQVRLPYNFETSVVQFTIEFGRGVSPEVLQLGIVRVV